MPKPRTWLWILVGVLGAGVLAVAAIVGAGAWFFSRHVQVSDAPEAAAAEAFAEIKRGFAGKAPLIDPSMEGRAAIAELDRRRAS